MGRPRKPTKVAPLRERLRVISTTPEPKPLEPLPPGYLAAIEAQVGAVLDSVDRIFWLSEKPDGAAPTDPDCAPPGDVAATDAPPDILRVQAVCSDGIRLTFRPERFADGAL